jgi:CRISPR locus-related DNA-binding protein|uniref:CRISPR locus-related DNA-binding protein n=1 Tax=Ignisphaera aggregans TaxID=334771 RepID=A0A7J3YTY3_9CREN
MTKLFDALIMTLGFEPGPLIRAAASYNLRTGASIIALTPSFKDERAERAYFELKNVCDILFKDTQVNFQKIEVDLTDFVRAVKHIKRLLSAFTNKHVALCFSGGMRALCLAVYTAYLMLEWQLPPSIEIHLEGRVERLIVPPLHKVIKVNISEEKLNILRLLFQHEKLSAGNIAALMHKDRSTVYRHLSGLFEDGLIKQKGKMYELTDLGLMLA